MYRVWLRLRCWRARCVCFSAFLDGFCRGQAQAVKLWRQRPWGSFGDVSANHRLVSGTSLERTATWIVSKSSSTDASTSLGSSSSSGVFSTSFVLGSVVFRCLLTCVGVSNDSSSRFPTLFFVELRGVVPTVPGVSVPPRVVTIALSMSGALVGGGFSHFTRPTLRRRRATKNTLGCVEDAGEHWCKVVHFLLVVFWGAPRFRRLSDFRAAYVRARASQSLHHSFPHFRQSECPSWSLLVL